MLIYLPYNILFYLRNTVCSILSVQYDPDKPLFDLLFCNYTNDEAKVENSVEKKDCVVNDLALASKTSKLFNKEEAENETGKYINYDTKSKKLSCTFCQSFQTTSKKNIMIHVMKHLNLFSYACDICKKKFRQQCNLTRHMIIHSKPQPKKVSMTLKKTTESDKSESEEYSTRTEVHADDITKVPVEDLHGKLIRKMKIIYIWLFLKMTCFTYICILHKY